MWLLENGKVIFMEGLASFLGLILVKEIEVFLEERSGQAKTIRPLV
jgi:hypothetical protein